MQHPFKELRKCWRYFERKFLKRVMKHCNIRLADKGLKANYLVNQLDFILHLQLAMSVYCYLPQHSTLLHCSWRVVCTHINEELIYLEPGLQMKGNLHNHLVCLSILTSVSPFPPSCWASCPPEEDTNGAFFMSFNGRQCKFGVRASLSVCRSLSIYSSRVGAVGSAKRKTEHLTG